MVEKRIKLGLFNEGILQYLADPDSLVAQIQDDLSTPAVKKCKRMKTQLSDISLDLGISSEPVVGSRLTLQSSPNPTSLFDSVDVNFL